VPLSSRADAVLARRHSAGASGLVFGTTNWNRYRQAWQRALRASKIADFHLHDLRHCYASWLVQRNRSLQEVKELLGHSDIKMTLRYSHLAPGHLRAAVASLDDVLPVRGTTTAQEAVPEVDASAKYGRGERI
jgi:integrase